MPRADAQADRGLDDGLGRHPEEEGAVEAAARAQLLRDDVDDAVLAVAREDAVFARADHDGAVLAVVDGDLLAVVEDVHLAALEVVHHELLPSDPAARVNERVSHPLIHWPRARAEGAGAGGGREGGAHCPGFLTTVSFFRLSAM